MCAQINYEKEILKFFYTNILKTQNPWFDVMFLEIKNQFAFTSVHPNELMFQLDQIYRNSCIEKRDYPKGSNFRIRLKGALRWENQYSKSHKKYTGLMIDILKFLKKVENEEVQLYEGTGNQWGIYPPKELKKKLSINNVLDSDISFIIHGMGNIYIRNDACGYSSSDGLIFFGKGKPILLKPGRDFLQYQEKLKNLFQSVQNPLTRQILLNEYEDIEYLIIREKWKDTAIKMGSILDYLTYDYFMQKNIKILNKPKPNFHDRMLHIRQHNLIGDPNDWLLADQILRDFRNFIHLQIMINQNITVDKPTVEILYPIFENLILLF